MEIEAGEDSNSDDSSPCNYKSIIYDIYFKYYFLRLSKR